MAVLRILQNGKLLQTLQMSEGQDYLCGRDSQCSIELADDAISRKHFKIAYEDGNWKVERVSKFGQIFYEGQPSSIILLKDIDGFSVPPFTFEFSIHQAQVQNAIEPIRASDERTAPVLIQSTLEDSSAPLTNEIEENTLASGGEAMASGYGVQQTNIPFENSKSKKLGHFGQELTNASEGRGSGYPQDSDNSGFSDENTVLSSTQLGLKSAAYVKVVLPSGAEEVHEMKGEVLKAGRSPQCDITIEDTKASRVHFEIRRAGNSFAILDQGSSNGTRLNGTKLEPEQAVILASGDEIQVGATRFYLEIRDTQFERALQNVRSDLLTTDESHGLVEYQQHPYEIMIQQGGAQLPYIPDDQAQVIYGGKKKSKRKKKNNKPVIIAAVVIVLLMFLFMDDEKTETTPVDNTKPPGVEDPFAALTPEQKQLVKNTYKLADNLIKRQMYGTALQEIEKLHAIVPSYEQSKDLETRAREGLNRLAELKALEEEEKRQREMKERIRTIVAKCDSLAKSTKNLSQVKSCLEPALELDVGNADAMRILEWLEGLERQKEVAQDNQRAYQAKVRSGEELYKRAESLRSRNAFYDAIDAYNRHINSPFPDPQNLKEKSKAAVRDIRSSLLSKVTGLIQGAEGDYSSKERAAAIKKLDQALDIDGENEKAKEMREKIISELRREMKPIYEDSVIEENMGNVDQAKEKWKKILETDFSGGDYYQKAKLKLKKYGE